MFAWCLSATFRIKKGDLIEVPYIKTGKPDRVSVYEVTEIGKSWNIGDWQAGENKFVEYVYYKHVGLKAE